MIILKDSLHLHYLFGEDILQCIVAIYQHQTELTSKLTADAYIIALKRKNMAYTSCFMIACTICMNLIKTKIKGII